MNLKETNSVIIELIDTYVNFLLPELKDKGINVKFNVDKEADSLEHGTMMASIINAKLS